MTKKIESRGGKACREGHDDEGKHKKVTQKLLQRRNYAKTGEREAMNIVIPRKSCDYC